MKKFIPILILIAFCSCNSKKKDTEKVLKIGSLEITKYEFEKNKKQEIGEKEEKQTSDWKNKFIDKCYIIADAYIKKYDTLTNVKKQIFYIGKIMMVQQGGYLWNETVTPVVDKLKVLTNEKIEKRKKLYYFDYISFSSLESLLEVTKGDTVIKTYNKYKLLKSKCKNDNIIKTGYFSNRWPFVSFWNYRENIYQLKPGEISRLILINGIYQYLYLDHIENIKITDQEKLNLQADLQSGIETELDDKKEVEMIAKGNIKPIEENIDKLLQFIKKEKNIFLFTKNLGLMTYTLNGELKTIYFNNFLDYYAFLPMKSDINDRNTLMSQLNQYYYNEYLSSEAEKLGLYKTDQYLLDQKNFQNKVVYSEYIKEEISNKIKVDSAEIKSFYINNKYKYTQPQIIIANFYYFNSADDALKNSHIISRFVRNREMDKASDPSTINGLVQFLPDVKLDLESVDYQESYINALISQDINSVSYTPILYEGKYVLVYKKAQEGKRYKKFEKVFNIAQNDLLQQKVEQTTKVCLDGLKKKYKIELDKTGIN